VNKIINDAPTRAEDIYVRIFQDKEGYHARLLGKSGEAFMQETSPSLAKIMNWVDANVTEAIRIYKLEKAKKERADRWKKGDKK
jgi:uncharacterized protein with NAD-binding domain and iron-sulfur cluster